MRITASLEVETVAFPNTRAALLVKVAPGVDAEQVIAALGLSTPRALLILSGGTKDLDAGIEEQLRPAFDGIVRVVTEKEIAVLTGGTNEGVFALFGQALQEQGGPTADCIGVAITGRAWPARLEPHHSHFVLVEGERWGEETDLMYRLAAALASDCPSVAVFAGGGPVVIEEMGQNVAQNREMILLVGGGGNTDAVVAARAKGSNAIGDIAEIASRGRITEFSIDRPPTELAELIRNRLLHAEPAHEDGLSLK
jgi:hypothetical protein